jgi:hypothetical protein
MEHKTKVIKVVLDGDLSDGVLARLVDAIAALVGGAVPGGYVIFVNTEDNDAEVPNEQSA